MVWATKHFRTYLYGHPCDAFTDHEALQALLNTPHPSGKLARWGMALQEMDLYLHYRPGKTNQNADALSRSPVATQSDVNNENVVAIISVPKVSDKNGERNELSESQMSDDQLRPIIDYLRSGNLPNDENSARELALNKKQYVLLDDVLYHMFADGTLRVIPPVKHR